MTCYRQRSFCEDTEELALTLNGRKRKLRRNDFVQAMTASGMDEKVIDNLFKKFIKAIPKWDEWIDVSVPARRDERQI